MSTRILSVFSLLKRVGFAILFLSASFVSHLNAAPLTVNAPSNTYFIANEGQWEGDFSFKCEVGSAVYYVTPKGLTVDFREFKRYPRPRDPGNPMDIMDRHEDRDSVTVRGHVVQIQYSGANRSLTSMGEGKLAHYSNYFLGRDSTQWRSRVGHYQNIIVPEVWPGIDVEYRADQLGVEAVYHVKPGADPTQIQIEYLGLDAPLRIDAQGNLVLATSLGDVKEKAPFAFQQEGNKQKGIDASLQIVDTDRIRFALAAYNSNKPLTIDPLLYSTYFANGWVDVVSSVTRDSVGDIIVCGQTYDPNFPITEGAYQDSMFDMWDPHGGFLTKFSSDFHTIIFSTFFSTIRENCNLAIAQDGSIWWAGWAPQPPYFPLTPDAFDTVSLRQDIGISNFSSDGTALLFSSYLGGDGPEESDIEYFGDLKLDTEGNVYVSGATESPENFPITGNALMSDYIPSRNGFLASLTSSGQLRYSTFFHGSGAQDFLQLSRMYIIEPNVLWINGITNFGNLPITPDAFDNRFNPDSLEYPHASFVMQFDLSQNLIHYCSYIGYQGNGHSLGVIWGNRDTLTIGGYTNSPTFPMPPGAYQPSFSEDYSAYFATLLLPDSIISGTFLGDSAAVFGSYHERMSDGSVICVGTTNTFNLPLTPNAFDTVFCNNGGSIDYDGFVARFDANFSRLIYSSYLGGCLYDYMRSVMTHGDTVYVVGRTQSTDTFPLTPDAMYPDPPAEESGFISKILAEEAVSANPRLVILTEHTYYLHVSPSPANAHVNISFVSDRFAHAEIEIFNLLGQSCAMQTLGDIGPGPVSRTFDLTRLASGSYWAGLTINKEQKALARFTLLK